MSKLIIMIGRKDNLICDFVGMDGIKSSLSKRKTVQFRKEI